MNKHVIYTKLVYSMTLTCIYVWNDYIQFYKKSLTIYIWNPAPTGRIVIYDYTINDWHYLYMWNPAPTGRIVLYAYKVNDWH